VDKSKLIAGRSFPIGEVEIEGVGTVTVRGLSRHEFIQAGKVREDKGEEQQERYLLSRCMVDPEMNEDDVAAWQKASGRSRSTRSPARSTSFPASGREPTKAAWLRFQTDPGYSFDFYLAAKLHRTVAELHRTMLERRVHGSGTSTTHASIQDRQLARR
jgi:hypothetical protein